MEKLRKNEQAEHDKVLVGMYAEVDGEIVKIVSVDNKANVAVVQFGEGGDTEPVKFEELTTLIATANVVDRFEGKSTAAGEPLERAA